MKTRKSRQEPAPQPETSDTSNQTSGIDSSQDLTAKPGIVRELREPQTRFEELLRDLARVAMSVTHHDIDDREPEAIHEIELMERNFRAVLTRYRAMSKL